ncbi:hypothetical protein D9757_000150 [Collybiopsis confluens]|uniref:Ubiquitin-like domain-containing protein n=1 Tax=Collybiopsis confluens TaxID=2823264 RepID=A0A8H5I240_9AGAR|nr:hypothetical protein D9757_000150 [Collybiopsis confluens]
MNQVSSANLISIRVELPAYGYSFTIKVPSETSVLSIKEAISSTCPGSPIIDGQRIIWRGRVLGTEEKIKDLWPSDEEVQRIVHLSVHPSAWRTDPPKTQEKGKGKEGEKDAEWVERLKAVAHSTSQPTAKTDTVATPSPATPQHLAFIVAKHRQALATLTQELSEFRVDPEDRHLAAKFVEEHGFIWPEILDEEVEPNLGGQGVKYAKQTIDGRPFLRLLNSTVTPTPAQIRALEILSYTIPLLNLPLRPSMSPTSSAHAPISPNPPSDILTGTPVQLPAHVNAILQQLGLPPIQDNPIVGPAQVHVVNDDNGVPHPAAQGQGGQLYNFNAFLDANGGQAGQNVHPPIAANPPQFQAAQIRPLIFPILMLSLRTLLLLYFVAPARKPFLAFMIIAWVIWEIWVPVREVFGRAGRAGDADGVQAMGDRQPQGAGEGPAGADVMRAGQVPPLGVNRGVQPPGNGPQVLNGAPPLPNNPPAGAAPNAAAAAGSILNTLASFDITEGETALQAFADSPTNAITQDILPEPGVGRKALSFIVLLLTTVHPAVWNKRRAILRAREGRVRVEMGALRETAPTQEETGDDTGDETSAEVLETQRRAALRAEISSKYMRRPVWVRRYMQRVFQAGEGGTAWGAGEEWIAEE